MKKLLKIELILKVKKFGNSKPNLDIVTKKEQEKIQLEKLPGILVKPSVEPFKKKHTHTLLREHSLLWGSEKKGTLKSTVVKKDSSRKSSLHG